jgi:hypothetical protein
VKSGPTEQIQKGAAQLFAAVSTLEDTTLNNTAVRKYKTKLLSRIALRILPARSNVSLRKGEYNPVISLASFVMCVIARLLSVDAVVPNASVREEIEVPEQVEIVLQQLFDLLQDRVDYSK